MEVNEIRNLIQSISTLTQPQQPIEGFGKKLLKNRFVIGSAFFASGVTFLNAMKHISLDSVILSVLPKELFTASMGGVPIGLVSSKLLGFTLTGTVIAEIIKVAWEIKQGKESVGTILVREGISLMILIFAFVLLGHFGIDLLNTVNAF